MSADCPESNPAVLILSDQAHAYARLLGPQSSLNIPLTSCNDPEEAIARYRGQPIVLGEPGLIAMVIERLPGVRWIQSTWAGVRPLLEVAEHNWQLTGVKGVFGPQMSEYVCGYLLAHELRIHQRADAQRQRRWDPTDSGTLHGKRAGIMGTGSIGSHIAATLRTFGVETRGFSRGGRPVEAFDAVFAANRLDEFLHDLDYLVATLPETPDTDRLLDARSLALLPPHAVFVNVGRGNVVDAAALAAALSAGRLGAAVLDVFEQEPLAPDDPLWTTPGLTVTGHVAARSRPGDMARVFIDNYRRFVDGRPLYGVVDFDRGY